MSTVEEILNAVRDLPPQEQAELKRRMERLTASSENAGEQLEDSAQGHVKDLHARIHQAMYEAGLVNNPNPPARNSRTLPPPIKVRGEPVSETIIKDRR